MYISKKIKTIYVLSFFFSLHIAISAYVNSTYLSGVIGEQYVGMLYAIASFIILLTLSKSTYILSKLGNKHFILLLLLANMLGLLALIKSSNPIFISIGFVTFQTTNLLVFFCLDIFMEHFASLKTIGKSRGTYLMINSLAWMLSPMISGFLITFEGGYKIIYLIALLAVILMTIALLISVRTFRDAKYKKAPFWKTYNFIKKNNHIYSINLIYFILQFFYVWMIIYTPIYLSQHIGLSWGQIGIIFTFMLLPFVLLGVPIGRLIDKKIINKSKLLVIGIFILAFSTLIIPLINPMVPIIVWAIILFITRVGASIVETTCEVYFFTHVKEEQSNLLSLFRDMNPVAFLIAPLLGTAILSFFNIRYMFFVLALVILLALKQIPNLRHATHKNSD